MQQMNQFDVSSDTGLGIDRAQMAAKCRLADLQDFGHLVRQTAFLDQYAEPEL